MKKSELVKLIRETVRNLSESEEYGFGMDEQNFGWDEEDLVSLVDWLDEVERISFEIKNKKRGSYSIDGDTIAHLLNDLMAKKEELDEIIDEISESAGIR